VRAETQPIIAILITCSRFESEGKKAKDEGKKLRIKG
jgi:hypothetical protein